MSRRMNDSPSRAALAAFGAASMLLATVPAQAADPGQLPCPADRLGAAERAQVVAHLRDRAAREDARFAPLERAIAACTERHGWSERTAELAVMHTLSALGQAEYRRDLAGRGVDVAPVEQAILADQALIRASVDGSFPEAEFEALVTRLQPTIEGIVEAQASPEEVGSELGLFIAFRTMMEATRLGFAAS